MATRAHEPLLHTVNSTSRTIKIIVSASSLLALIISVAFLAPNLIKKLQSRSPTSPHVCALGYSPEECLRAFANKAISDGVNVNYPNSRIQMLLHSHILEIKNAVVLAKHIKNQVNGLSEQGPLEDCLELMDLSIDRLKDSIFAIESFTSHSLADAQAWLSGVLANHETCFDGLSVLSRASMEKIMKKLISRAKASLALLVTAIDEDQRLYLPSEKLKLPSWLTLNDRNLLESSVKDIEADLVVAQDGTGDYETLTEALAAAPNKSKTRFVIHVKEGVYEENVEVIKNKKNLMIIGDGMNLTVITGSLNVVDGSTTFRSATLAAVGDGFILQDICIQNTAGPEKHQAVALRVGADKAVINRCQITAFQDTLYTHSLRQFYRDCYITGTVDFIFGNAAVVLQNCNLVARKPMSGQKNMVTAQGRTDPNQNTGTTIQNCNITASDDLEPARISFPTYLGRPWKEYARVVIMESYISDNIDPAGWSVWSGDFALDTCYFGEYNNRGPGAGLSKRVNWTGYHVITDAAEAMKFTVAELIQGGEWIATTGVAFTEGLMD